VQTILAMLDEVAEQLEGRGSNVLARTVDETRAAIENQTTIAAVLDAVSEELLSREACGDDEKCAELVRRADTLADQFESGARTLRHAHVLDRISEALVKRKANDRLVRQIDAAAERLEGTFPTIKIPTSTQPDAVLVENADQIVQAVSQYGAHKYRVDGSVVEIDIDRGESKTTASLQFCTRDEVGNPQLRVLFRSGNDKMVRWASVDRMDGGSLAHAVRHVFATGQNYGAHVVTATTKHNPYSARPRRK